MQQAGYITIPATTIDCDPQPYWEKMIGKVAFVAFDVDYLSMIEKGREVEVKNPRRLVMADGGPIENFTLSVEEKKKLTSSKNRHPIDDVLREKFASFKVRLASRQEIDDQDDSLTDLEEALRETKVFLNDTITWYNSRVDYVNICRKHHGRPNASKPGVQTEDSPRHFESPDKDPLGDGSAHP